MHLSLSKRILAKGLVKVKKKLWFFYGIIQPRYPPNNQIKK